MKVINVYSRYYAAECLWDECVYHGVMVNLEYGYEPGYSTYSVHVVFFPHEDKEDYAITYDCHAYSILLEGKGRRTRKKEPALLEEMRKTADMLADHLEGTIFWERPLREARLG